MTLTGVTRKGGGTAVSSSALGDSGFSPAGRLCEALAPNSPYLAALWEFPCHGGKLRLGKFTDMLCHVAVSTAKRIMQHQGEMCGHPSQRGARTSQGPGAGPCCSRVPPQFILKAMLKASPWHRGQVGPESGWEELLASTVPAPPSPGLLSAPLKPVHSISFSLSLKTALGQLGGSVG